MAKDAKDLKTLVKEALESGLERLNQRMQTLAEREQDFEAQLTAIRHEKLALQAEYKVAVRESLKELGISLEPPAPPAAPHGKRPGGAGTGPLTAAATAAVEQLINAAKGQRLSAGEVAESLAAKGIEGSASKSLKVLVDKGAIDKEGEGRARRYMAK